MALVRVDTCDVVSEPTWFCVRAGRSTVGNADICVDDKAVMAVADKAATCVVDIAANCDVVKAEICLVPNCSIWETVKARISAVLIACN